MVLDWQVVANFIERGGIEILGKRLGQTLAEFQVKIVKRNAYAARTSESSRANRVK